jgi:hypothetical protein
MQKPHSIYSNNKPLQEEEFDKVNKSNLESEKGRQLDDNKPAVEDDIFETIVDD